MFYSFYGFILLAIVSLLIGCSEKQLAPCPVILNPLNAGQYLKLIPNQKINEYTIALICSTDSPAIVGNSQICLTQSEHAKRIQEYFAVCSGSPKNGPAPTAFPTGKGQFRPALPITNQPDWSPVSSTSTAQPGVPSDAPVQWVAPPASENSLVYTEPAPPEPVVTAAPVVETTTVFVTDSEPVATDAPTEPPSAVVEPPPRVASAFSTSLEDDPTPAPPTEPAPRSGWFSSLSIF